MSVAILGTPGSVSKVGQDTGLPNTDLAYAVSAGSNRLLVLFVGTGDSLLISASAVTYGGQAGAQITGYLKNDANYVLTQAWYWLEAGIAAAVGTTFTIATWSSGAGNAIDALGLGAAAFSGVHQTVPFGTVVVANGSSTAPSTGSITVGTDELAIGSISTDDDNAIVQASTLIFELEGINSDVGFGAQSRATTGALDWTTDNVAWAVAGIAVKPAAAGGGDLSVGVGALGEPVVGGSSF